MNNNSNIPHNVAANALSGELVQGHDDDVLTLVSHVAESKMVIKESQNEGYQAYINLTTIADNVSQDVRDSIGNTHKAVEQENKAMEANIDKLMKAKVENNATLFDATLAACLEEFKFALGFDVSLKAVKFAAAEKKPTKKFMQELTARQSQKTFSKTDCLNYDRKIHHFSRYVKACAINIAKGSEDITADQLLLSVQTDNGETVIKAPKAKTEKSATAINDAALKAILKGFSELNVSSFQTALEQITVQVKAEPDLVEKMIAGITKGVAILAAATAEEVKTKADAAAAALAADKENEAAAEKDQGGDDLGKWLAALDTAPRKAVGDYIRLSGVAKTCVANGSPLPRGTKTDIKKAEAAMKLAGIKPVDIPEQAQAQA